MSMLMRLGRDFGEYDELHVSSLDGEHAAAICVGSDRRSPSLRYKGDLRFRNEDALLVARDAGRSLLAVADAHFGLAASHELMTALSKAISDRIPSSPEALEECIFGLPPTATTGDSASSFVVAVFDRDAALGFGLSFGDSTVCLLGPGVEAAGRALNPHNHRYVALAGVPELQDCGAQSFDFSAPDGSLLLAFSDGIDECHYRNPESSIRPSHLRALFAELGAAPEPFVRALAELALAGVDGHPGGQDNIALIAARL